jgi:hypothetical protein
LARGDPASKIAVAGSGVGASHGVDATRIAREVRYADFGERG